MVRRTGMSQSAVSRIWRAFGLRPHQADTFKLSADPAFVEKVRDVVGLYLAHPIACCPSGWMRAMSARMAPATGR